MNFIKRSITCVLRKPGKSLILLVLIFILGNVIAGAISVKQAIGSTKKAINDKIGVELGVELDFEKYLKDGGSKEDIMKIASLTPVLIDSIGSSRYIRYYDYSTKAWLEGVGLANYIDPNMPGIPEKGGIGQIQSSFELSGGQNPGVLDIQQGKASLYQGRVFTAQEIKGSSNPALISKNLAQQNALSVGSVIKFKRDIYKNLYIDKGKAEVPQMPEIYKTLEFDFTIIGIFEPRENVAVDENGQLQVIQSELENRIYTTNNSINTINEQVSEAEMQANGTNVSYNFNNIMPTFVLKYPEALQAFKEEALPKLPKYFRFTDNSAQFKNISTPMKNMDWISGIVLYVAVGATVLILSLLVTLFLRDRRHEMGIYLSLGERKFKVAAQIVIEVMAIAVIAVSLSLFSGNIAAKNMSGKMLENQIIAEQQNNTDNPGKVFPGGMGGSNYAISSQELMDSYNVNLGTDTVLFIYLIGIGTIFISTLVPIFYTLRLNPKKILM